jgi:hypothetical protein
MRVRGKPTHIRADLRHNDLSAQLADPRNGAQALDGVTKAGEPDIDLLINFCDASIKRVDLLQMQTKQETMVAFDPSTRASRSVMSALTGGTLPSCRQPPSQSTERPSTSPCG